MTLRPREQIQLLPLFLAKSQDRGNPYAQAQRQAAADRECPTALSIERLFFLVKAETRERSVVLLFHLPFLSDPQISLFVMQGRFLERPSAQAC